MMFVAHNSIWEFSHKSKVGYMKVRVLCVDPGGNHFIVIDTECPNSTALPFLISIDSFEHSISSGTTEQLAQHSGLPDQESKCPSPTALDERDKRYAILEPLVSEPEFLPTIASLGRSKLISMHARKTSTSYQCLRRWLYAYYSSGQFKDGLLPSYSKRGGPGKNKSVSDKKRGRPIKSSKFGFEFDVGVNVTPEDVKKFISGTNQYIHQHPYPSLAGAYSWVKNEYYRDEIERVRNTGKHPRVPSIEQFKYWLRKEKGSVHLLKQIVGDKDWEKNHRGLPGSASAYAKYPGRVFEIDATPVKCELVSSFDRSRRIGSPTLYLIVDVASRMITGFYIGLEEASWLAASQALLSMALPKTNLLNAGGNYVSHEEWPCFHLPTELLCDKGELIGLSHENAVKQLGYIPGFTGSGRPDMKPVVERKFGHFNNELFEKLLGGFVKRHRSRGSHNPKKHAALTINELSSLVVDAIIHHNLHSEYDCLVYPDIIKDDAEFTPFNFWKWHINTHRHSLRTLDEKSATKFLLPERSATVARDGIYIDDIRYISDQAIKEGWLTSARNFGRIELNAWTPLYDRSRILVQSPHTTETHWCVLSDDYSHFQGLHDLEIDFFNEYKRSKANSSKKIVSEYDCHTRMMKVQNHAKSQTALAKDLSDKTNSSIRENRQAELAHLRSSEDVSKQTSPKPKSTEQLDRKKSRILRLISNSDKSNESELH